MKKYIHIGYPKNFSTSLQRDYFAKHPEIDHLGIGVGSNLGYKDDWVEKALEVYLKTCKSYKYKEAEHHLKEHFQTLFNATNETSKIVGISAEHLSFAFTYDGLSNEEKANRLYHIFGEDTKIIMLVRSQDHLLRSLFRECVRVGFGGDYAKFIALAYKYQDRNFVYDFRYDYVFETYASLFGKENIGVFFFENYRNDSGTLTVEGDQVKLFSDLNDFLGISQIPMELGHYNEAIPSEKILIKAKLNESNRHDLGNHLYESAEKHRIKKYLEEDLRFFEEEAVTYEDVITKRALVEEALNSEQSQVLSYDCNENLAAFFSDFYQSGNERFATLLNKEVPSNYMNLKF